MGISVTGPITALHTVHLSLTSMRTVHAYLKSSPAECVNNKIYELEHIAETTTVTKLPWQGQGPARPRATSPWPACSMAWTPCERGRGLRPHGHDRLKVAATRGLGRPCPARERPCPGDDPPWGRTCAGETKRSRTHVHGERQHKIHGDYIRKEREYARW